MAEQQLPISYLIIDWGTTNFRAFAMSAEHRLLSTKEAALGLLQVPDGDFASALQRLLARWLVDYTHLPIYMAGMVGSAKGWVNVDYAPTPAGGEKIAGKVHQFSLPWGATGSGKTRPLATIFPGVSHLQHNKYDVMRGEEVQLLGVAEKVKQSSFSAILPGTHAKHVCFQNNAITEFATYLTGELYSTLFSHSLLGKGLSQPQELDITPFIKGVEDSCEGALMNRAFLAWTCRLFQQLNEQQVPDYLSGMLIGYELREFKHSFAYLVGGHSLCQRYQVAANHLGIDTAYISGNECFLLGMTTLIKELANESC